MALLAHCDDGGSRRCPNRFVYFQKHPSQRKQLSSPISRCLRTARQDVEILQTHYRNPCPNGFDTLALGPTFRWSRPLNFRTEPVAGGMLNMSHSKDVTRLGLPLHDAPMSHRNRSYSTTLPHARCRAQIYEATVGNGPPLELFGSIFPVSHSPIYFPPQVPCQQLFRGWLVGPTA